MKDTPDQITTITDGYIKKVAEHIDDCIHPVATALPAITSVANDLEPIDKVSGMASIDYAEIFNNGL